MRAAEVTTMTNKESLDTNDRLSEAVHPSGTRSRENAHEVACSVCEDRFFVDDHTYDRIRRSLSYDPTDNPFVCSRCESLEEEEAHGH